MRNRSGKLDVAHALAAHAAQRDFHAALFADDALVLHPLVLAAQAFVVLDRTEDARAEKAVTLRLERAVVDRFRLLDLAVGPRKDLLRARYRNPDGVKILGGSLRIEKICNLLVHAVLLAGKFPNLMRGRFVRCVISKPAKRCSTLAHAVKRPPGKVIPPAAPVYSAASGSASALLPDKELAWIRVPR
jgi:hypothetical protein